MQEDIRDVVQQSHRWTLRNADICLTLSKISRFNFLSFLWNSFQMIPLLKAGAALTPTPSPLALTHRVPVQLLNVHKDSHQLGDGHGWVGVVQLDGNL